MRSAWSRIGRQGYLYSFLIRKIMGYRFNQELLFTFYRQSLNP